MTPTERSECEQELTARVAYVESIRVNGSEHVMRYVRNAGWSVRDWRGAEVGAQLRKRAAVSLVRGIAEQCAVRITELRAQLEAAAFDAEMAATTPEERMAGARAQEMAIDGPRWRRTA